MPDRITDEAVTPDSLIAKYAARLDAIYANETAGSHTFTGVLAQFAHEFAALPVLNTTKDSETREAIAVELERLADEHHGHRRDRAYLLHRAASLRGVSGEDRSEPTPAPREPQPGDMVRLDVGGKVGEVVGELVLIADGDDPVRQYVRAHADGREWLVAPNGQRRRIKVLSEVVTPEGPA